MMSFRSQPPSAVAFLLGLAGLMASGGATTPIRAQDWGPTRVGVTSAARADVQTTIELAGAVEAATHAIVASEEAGVVERIAAEEGSAVSRGVILATLRRATLERDLDAARGQLAEAQARLDLAQRSRRRSEELHTSGVISRQQLDDAESEAGAWQGRVDQASALIARLETQIRRSAIRAPFSGIVVQELCDVGEWVPAGGPVVEMFDPRTLGVVVQVPERYFRDAALDSEVRIDLDALSETSFTGRVVAIIPRADPTARTFPVKVAFTDPSEAIGLGMTATVSMPAGPARPAVIVPKDAIVSRGLDRLVYTVGPGPPDSEGSPTEVATAVPVRVGGAIGAWNEVDGLQEGDRVITRGNERLAPGATLLTEPVEYPLP